MVLAAALEKFPLEWPSLRNATKQSFDSIQDSKSLYETVPILRQCSAEFLAKCELYAERRLYSTVDSVAAIALLSQLRRAGALGDPALVVDGEAMRGSGAKSSSRGDCCGT